MLRRRGPPAPGTEGLLLYFVEAETDPDLTGRRQGGTTLRGKHLRLRRASGGANCEPGARNFACGANYLHQGGSICLRHDYPHQARGWSVAIQLKGFLGKSPEKTTKSTTSPLKHPSRVVDGKQRRGRGDLNKIRFRKIRKSWTLFCRVLWWFQP